MMLKFPLTMLAVCVGVIGVYAEAFEHVTSSECGGGRLELRDVDSLGRALVTGTETLGDSNGGAAAMWNTTTLADGWHTISNGVESTQVCIRNDLSISVEGGRLAEDVVWDRSTLHLVRNWVVVPNGKKLTISEGCIVKFCENTGIWVERGGMVNIDGSEIDRVVFASAGNDDYGGDTNLREGDHGTNFYQIVALNGCRWRDSGFWLAPDAASRHCPTVVMQNVIADVSEGVIRVPITVDGTCDTPFSLEGSIEGGSGVFSSATGPFQVTSSEAGARQIEIPIHDNAVATGLVSCVLHITRIRSADGWSSSGEFSTESSLQVYGSRVTAGPSFECAVGGMSPSTMLNTVGLGGTIVTNGAVEVAYSPCWNGASNCVVRVDNDILKVASLEGQVQWRPSVTGYYTLSHAAGGETLTADFAVVGENTLVHTSVVSDVETWGTNQLHLVMGDVSVVAGAQLTIERGAIVKFLPGSSLSIDDEAVCSAIGAKFTSAYDRNQGGDYLNAGVHVPEDDQYAVAGPLTIGTGTEFRYLSNTPEGAIDKSRLYMVVDLLGGASATSYPVFYLDSPPVDGWTDEYKSTKLVMRRIAPGTFTMGCATTEPGYMGSEAKPHEVTITQPYYIGVFEVTQKQYELVMGDNPSTDKGDMRPVASVPWEAIRGDMMTYSWPVTDEVAVDSFIGRLRSKVGNAGFDLPTDAQWEYACRAGTATPFNDGGNPTSPEEMDVAMNRLGRYNGNANDGLGGNFTTHTIVGSYVPNAWGLYDMHGNVWEYCVDWYQEGTNFPSTAVEGERGFDGPLSGTRRLKRGGGYDVSANYCRSALRMSTSNVREYTGMRLCCTMVDTPNPDVSIVTFDLGDHGSPTGWVELVQTVTNGCAAVAPGVVPNAGWRFEGWDRDFSCVTNDLTVTALYTRVDWERDAAGNVLIADISDLVRLQQWVAAGYGTAGMTFVQTADIDMAGAGAWDGIGGNGKDTAPFFQGTYDGNGKTIYNLTLARAKYRGFFDSVRNATIRNLTINVAGFAAGDSEAGFAAFVGSASGTTLLQRLKATGTIGTSSAYSKHTSAGIAVSFGGVIDCCTNSATIFAASDNTKIGGMVGIAQGGATVLSNCVNTAALTANQNGGYVEGVGGLVGFNSWSVTLVNCVNTGAITDETNAGRGGEIIGYAQGPVAGEANVGRAVGPAIGLRQSWVAVRGFDFAYIVDGTAEYFARDVIGDVVMEKVNLHTGVVPGALHNFSNKVTATGLALTGESLVAGTFTSDAGSSVSTADLVAQLKPYLSAYNDKAGEVGAHYDLVQTGTNPNVWQVRASVAQIVGGSSYVSLADAVAAATAGDTIQLIADIEGSGLTNNAIVIDRDLKILSEGAKKTLTGFFFTVDGGASVAFENVSFRGVSRIDTKNAKGLRMASCDTLVSAPIPYPNSNGNRSAFIMPGVTENCRGELLLVLTNNTFCTRVPTSAPAGYAFDAYQNGGNMFWGHARIANGSKICDNVFGSAENPIVVILGKIMGAGDNAVIDFANNTIFYGARAGKTPANPDTFWGLDFYISSKGAGKMLVRSRDNAFMRTCEANLIAKVYVVDGENDNVLFFDNGTIVNGVAVTLASLKTGDCATFVAGANMVADANGKYTAGDLLIDLSSGDKTWLLASGYDTVANGDHFAISRKVPDIPPSVTHVVTFDLGDHGSPTGWVEFVQTVTNGCAAVAPGVVPNAGWRFEGWDRDFSCVTNDLTVTAQWSQIEVEFDDGTGRTWHFGDIYERVVDTPVVDGGTQLVLTAWSAWNISNVNVIASGTNATVRFELQNAGPYGVKMVWMTNYWLNVSLQGNYGTLDPVTGWYPAGTEVVVHAAPVNEHCKLVDWHGDTEGCTGANGELSVPMTHARSLVGEFDVERHAVRFDVGEHGTRTGGGALEQLVAYDASAQAPSVRANSGWTFLGWLGSYTHVTGDVQVVAQYKTINPDLHVDVVSNGVEALSGGRIDIAWTIGNSGNSLFRGSMKERVILVSEDDTAVSNVIATVDFSGTIPADGTVERHQSITVPLRGWVGRWLVVVQTAVSPSAREFGGDNFGLSDQVLEIQRVPLPDLVADSVAGETAMLVPGTEMQVAYRLRNVGDDEAAAPWTDVVCLESVDGQATTLLGRVNHGVSLAAGGETVKNVEFDLPELVPLAGEVRIKVLSDFDDAMVEADDENIAYGPIVALATNLYLSAATDSVKENQSSSGVRFTIKRSGPVSAPMTVSLTADVAGQVTMPETVTIPAGNASTVFYVKPVDNAVAEGCRVIAISASSGNCLPATFSLTILDNEIPKLFLTMEGISVREGEGAVSVTLTRELASDEPLTVALSGVPASRCSYPSSVVIPAGERSVVFEITAVDDNIARIADMVTLRAAANGHTSGSMTYTVEDDDIPGVTLSMTPEEVSEGAGAQAIIAVLTRSDTKQIKEPITVRLAASADGQLILPSSVTIPAYTMAVRFAIGVVDNGLDDGDREVTVTGAIYVKSCGCSGLPSNGDVIEGTVRINDNDGPSLSLQADPSTMKEGQAIAGYLVLSHNSTLTEDMTVTLSYDLAGEIELPQSVVIPAGVSSVRIPVKTLDDGVEDGGKLVSVYADDDFCGFAPGSTWIQVSDQNLPDIRIDAVSLDASSVVGGNSFEVAFDVVNAGFNDRGEKTPYAVYLVTGNSVSLGDARLLVKGTTGGGLTVGEAETVTVAVTASETPGDYRIAVVADPDSVVSELDEANNTGWSQTMTVTPSYTANVEVRKDIYLPGERVFLDGVAMLADGVTPASNVPVEVYVLNSPYRRIYNVTTDAEGRFTAEFKPVTGEGGHYSAGASYPMISASAVQCAFDILGLKRTSTSYLTSDMVVGETRKLTTSIQNLSSIPLTNLRVRHDELPNDFGLNVSVVDHVPGSGVVNVEVEVVGLSATPKEITDYRKVMIYVESDEGVSLSFPVYVYVRDDVQIKIAFSPTRVDKKMTVGEVQYVDVELVNTGRDPTGTITLNVPTAKWLKLMNSSELPSMASGERQTITLELTPTDGMALNSPITGNIQARESVLGASVKLPFSFTPVVESTGRIRVLPKDEYTYYQAGEPRVAGASVKIVNPYTGATVATGKTDANGEWTSPELPCGTYSVSVSASQHTGDSAKLTVEPGMTTDYEPFMTYNAVSYSWDVKRVEIEDSYEIKLVADYVTSVPKPTVVLSVPDEIPKLNEGESYTFNVTAVNHGLISALNVSFSFPTDFPYVYEFATDVIAEIPAKSSVTVPVKVYMPRGGAHLQSLGKGARLAAAEHVTAPTPNDLEYFSCSYGLMAWFEYMCGPEFRQEVARSANIQILGAACDAFVTLIRHVFQNFPAADGGCGGGPHLPGTGGGGGDWIDRLMEQEPFSQDFVNANCMMGLKLLECISSMVTEGLKFKNTIGKIISLGRWHEGTMDDIFQSFIIDTANYAGELRDDYNEAIGDDRNEDLAYLRQYLSGSLEDLGENGIPDNANKVRDFLLNRLQWLSGECIDAIGYYFDTYRHVRDAEIARRRANMDGGAGQGEGESPQSADEDDAEAEESDLDNQAPPEIQDEVMIFATAATIVEKLLERSHYVLGPNDDWENPSATLGFSMFIGAALAEARDRAGVADGRLVAFAQEEVAMMKLFNYFGGEVSNEAIDAFVERWNRSVAYYDADKFTEADLAPDDNRDFIDIDVLNSYNQELIDYHELLSLFGYDSVNEALEESANSVRAYLNENSGDVCARVSLKFEQTITVAREAFEGTLTIYNGNNSKQMRDIRLAVRISDADGNLCNDLFGITEREMSGFAGASMFQGGVSLAARSSGVGSFLFVPTADAAPTGVKLYYFGGTLSYVDPLTGKDTVVTLAPVPLTVNPCPKLTIHYFLQQEVFGDDPLTPDMVEPSVPAELALLVVNDGAGMVRNLTVKAAQPEKFVNEKGLAVDFKLSDFEVAGTTVNGAAGGSILSTDLGTIAGGGSAQAQWWLTSSLQGRFTGMKAEFTQLNDWGNPKTCLIDSVKLHPLVGSVEAGATDKPDYLVREDDSSGFADTVYLDDGTVLDVHSAELVASGTARGREFEVDLSFDADEAGAWYGVIDDPGVGRYVITSVLRGDGSEMPIGNVWIRDRSINERGAPEYGSKLHFFDVVPVAGPQRYTVTFVAMSDDFPEVELFEDVVDGVVETEVRDSVTVAFASAIDPDTFTVDDLSLIGQGNVVDDLSGLVVDALDNSNRRFKISGLASLCAERGRYELVVQCVGIEDTLGNCGFDGRSVSWVYAGGEMPYVVNVEGLPDRPVNSLDSITLVVSGAVTPESLSMVAMSLNGDDITGSLTATAVDAWNTRFAISGLEALQRADGEYVLTLEGSGLRTPEGLPGIGDFRVSWTLDSTAPTVNGVVREEGMDGVEFIVEMSEEIVADSIGLERVRLTRDGQSLVLPRSAAIENIGNGRFRVVGLGAVLADDGNYELTFDSVGVVDVAGNVATGSKSVSWTVDTTPPSAPTGLGVSSEYGSVDTVVQTSEGTMTVRGVVPEAGVTVQMLSRYLGGDEVLLATPEVANDGSFSAEVALPENGGNLTLVVRLVDAAGNSSDTEIKTYYDRIALTAELSGAPELGVVADEVSLAFSDAVVAGDVTLAKFALTHDGTPVALEGVTLTANADGKTFTLAGLSPLCSVDGDYVLSFAATDVRKRSSGLGASACAPLVWRYECPDREPPVIEAMRIDGEDARGVYTNGIGSIEIQFSEDVNIQELSASGLIGQVLKIQLLDADSTVTGTVRAVQSEVACEADGVLWTLPVGAVGAGCARVLVDAGLVTDLAGNHLADGDGVVVGGLQGFEFTSDLIATVDSYAMPTWYDYDGDGLGDLVVGEKTSSGEGKVRIYRNVGTVTEPQFSGYEYLKIGDADLSIAASGCQGAQVAFGDLTGDGHDDLIVGYANGKVQLWRGTETRGVYDESEVLLTGAETSYGSPRAFVCAFDVDGDGRIELIVGGLDGKFRKFKYATEGGSNETWITDASGAPLAVAAGRSTPVLVDVNNDGCVDILTGDTVGNIWAFLGDGGSWNSTPAMMFDNATAKLSDRSRIGFADVNGDGIGDLLVGRTNGSVELAPGVNTDSPALAFRVKGTYTVTFDLGELGTLKSGELVQSVVEDDPAVAPEVTVDDCYTFDGWDVTFDSIVGDVVVHAGYTHKPPVKLTVTGVIAGAEAASTYRNGEYEAVYGDEIAVTVPKAVTNLAENVMACVGWTGSGSIPSAGTAESVVARMTGDSTIAWAWEVSKWWLELGTENGRFSVESGWQTAGSTIQVTAIPDEHYVFKQWNGDLDGCTVDGGVANIVVDRRRAVAAEFELARHRVVLGGGLETTVPPAGVYDYSYGSMVTVAVVNAIQYSGATQFVCRGWSAVGGEPSSGNGTQAVFRVLGDVDISWTWRTNVLSLSRAVNLRGANLTTGGASEWLPKWTNEAADGEHLAWVGGIAVNTNSYMETTVDGAGEISFAWCSSLASRNTKLQFMVDGTVERMLTGTNNWTMANVVVYGDGCHTLRWRLLTGRSGVRTDDFAALDQVCWVARTPPTLAEALNTNLVWTTGGDVEWKGVWKESPLDSRESWAKIVGLGDDAVSFIETEVYGNGVLAFDWSVSCEEGYDWMQLVVDGEVVGYLDGQIDWSTHSIVIDGSGWHTVRWEYVKDEMDDPELVGGNMALLDNVAWLSSDQPDGTRVTVTTPVPVPYFELERKRFRSYLDAAGGDHELAAHAIGKNGQRIWESYVAGLNPDVEDSRFVANIVFRDGKPVIGWHPALNGEDDNGVCIREGTRIYQIEGSNDLRNWQIVPVGEEGNFRFFKVRVSLP